jgi:hypothetical protein
MPQPIVTFALPWITIPGTLRSFSRATTQYEPVGAAAARPVTLIVGAVDRNMEEKINGR